MIPPTRLPDFAVGERLTAAKMQRLKQAVEDQGKIAFDPQQFEVIRTPGAGLLVRLLSRSFEVAYLPSGTIAARTGTLPTITWGGPTNVTLLKLNTTGTGLVTTSTTVPCYNPWATAVPASKLIVMIRLLRRRIALAWDC